MKLRIEHCAFKRLNSNGKCIADCIYTRQEGWDRDCIGNNGKTMDTETIREVQIGRGRKLEL